MDELIFADGTKLENCLCLLNRDMLNVRAIKKTLKQTFNIFSDSNKTSRMTIKRGASETQIEGYTRLVMLMNTDSISIKMQEVE